MKAKAKGGREVKKVARKSSSPASTDFQPLTPNLSPNTRSAGVKPDQAQSIRILVVDDHPLFRHGLVQLLGSEPGFSVCGESSTAPEALSMIRKLNPNLVIADVGLTGPSG